ncbi:MAG: VWA domain-containing protein, partial [Pseudomonadota bacterium]|nr:VWA domain-containing protein [Pseudomonadota bacterium]
SVEHWNAESGQTWLTRVLDQWPAAIWLNPVQEAAWTYTQSIQIIREIFAGRMFPLTLQGIDAGVKALSRG